MQGNVGMMYVDLRSFGKDGVMHLVEIAECALCALALLLLLPPACAADRWTCVTGCSSPWSQPAACLQCIRCC